VHAPNRIEHLASTRIFEQIAAPPVVGLKALYRGITVIWRDDAIAVIGIVVSKRNAGALNGVRVWDV